MNLKYIYNINLLIKIKNIFYIIKKKHNKLKNTNYKFFFSFKKK